MKKYLAKKLSWHFVCFMIIILVIISYFGFEVIIFPNYHYSTMCERLLSWNLRELGNYPEHQIIYVMPTSKGTAGDAAGYVRSYEVGVYPYLDDELEKRIRDLGYPFDFRGITYVGTDSYDDISKAVSPYSGIVIEENWVEHLISPDR